MSILHFVSSSVWKSLFGKAADSLERSIDHTDEFMIIDYEPIASTFVSIPTDLGQLSADAYVSGIVAGVLGKQKLIVHNGHRPPFDLGILCSDCETSDNDDILTCPWIELTCAHDMVLQFH